MEVSVMREPIDLYGVLDCYTNFRENRIPHGHQRHRASRAIVGHECYPRVGKFTLVQPCHLRSRWFRKGCVLKPLIATVQTFVCLGPVHQPTEEIDSERRPQVMYDEYQSKKGV
ncbi:hypothetical protein ACRALDRAFT_1074132, partial [Sodiomyces alcalophilus JCM 7366]|uniref:uncharacterized protein n=1 Tax=Sodiomyces alcalophilus JCM 7366 TaxID=591952 RepID=UPI0039B43A09